MRDIYLYILLIMRYKSIPTIKTKNGKRAIGSSLLPRMYPKDSDTFVIMVEKTRLDHIAFKFYNNPNYWWIIASANEIKGTMYAEEGIQLRVPTNINQILQEFERINGY